MPVYLLHGFRWPRAGFTGIRVHIILHQLDDCSADYIQNSRSQAELLESFRKSYPELMKAIEPSLPAGTGQGSHGISFVEQYDPTDETGENAVSQPYAYVADRVVTLAGGLLATRIAAVAPTATAQSTGNESIPSSSAATTTTGPPSNHTAPSSMHRSSKGSVSAGIAAAAAHRMSALSLNVEDVVAEGPGVSAAAWEALADLRDKIAPREKIGWWIVYNGDPERAYEVDDEDSDEYGEGEDEEGEEKEVKAEREAEGLGDQHMYPDWMKGTRGGRHAQAPPNSHQPRPSAVSSSSSPVFPHPSDFPLPERTRRRPSTPKPHTFESSDPSRRSPSPILSVSQPQPRSPLASFSDRSGKRLPGMKATTATPSSVYEQQKEDHEQEQQQQQQQQRTNYNDPPLSPPPPPPQETTDQRKPKQGPKSEILKKKLFGKRG